MNWIRQSILQALAEQNLVRLPQNKIGTYNKANKAMALSRTEEPSTEELSELPEMSKETEINNIFPEQYPPHFPGCLCTKQKI